MYENLKKLRLEKGMNQKEFAAELGIRATTYNGYEVGTSDPKTEFWISTADRYKVSTDFLLGLTDDKRGTKYGARSELDEKYAALAAHGRRVADLVIGAEAERVEAQKAAVEETPQEPPMVKIVPLFPAAAGPGEPVDGSVFDIAVNALPRFFNASRLQLRNNSVIALHCRLLNYSLLAPFWQ